MKYIMLLRKYFKNIELDLDKIKVKILMSKFEILSNNSVSKDLDKI
jgi:hypothetical protein